MVYRVSVKFLKYEHEGKSKKVEKSNLKYIHLLTFKEIFSNAVVLSFSHS